MIRVVSDLYFAEVIFRRYGWEQGVDSPARLVFLLPDGPEEPPERAAYNNTIWQITNITNLTEHNHIVNLSISLTLLNRLISSSVREIASTYSRGGSMLEKTLLLRREGNAIKAGRDASANARNPAVLESEERTEPRGILFPSDLDVVRGGLGEMLRGREVLTPGGPAPLSLIYGYNSREGKSAQGQAATSQPEPSQHDRATHNGVRTPPDFRAAEREQQPNLQTEGNTPKGKAPTNAPDKEAAFIPFRQRSSSIFPEGGETRILPQKPEVSAVLGEEGKLLSGLPGRMIGLPPQALVYLGRELARREVVASAPMTGQMESTLVRTSPGQDITRHSAVLLSAGSSPVRQVNAVGIPEAAGQTDAARREGAPIQEDAPNKGDISAQILHLREMEQALPATVYRRLTERGHRDSANVANPHRIAEEKARDSISDMVPLTSLQAPLSTAEAAAQQAQEGVSPPLSPSAIAADTTTPGQREINPAENSPSIPISLRHREQEGRNSSAMEPRLDRAESRSTLPASTVLYTPPKQETLPVPRDLPAGLRDIRVTSSAPGSAGRIGVQTDEPGRSRFSDFAGASLLHMGEKTSSDGAEAVANTFASNDLQQKGNSPAGVAQQTGSPPRAPMTPAGVPSFSKALTEFAFPTAFPLPVNYPADQRHLHLAEQTTISGARLNMPKAGPVPVNFPVRREHSVPSGYQEGTAAEMPTLTLGAAPGPTPQSFPSAATMLFARPAADRPSRDSGGDLAAPTDITRVIETARTNRTVSETHTTKSVKATDLDIQGDGNALSAGQTVDIERIADRVYASLERRLRSERMRKGLGT
ncbi:MAG: hypothetical protein ACK5LX_17015 [Oscillospiraceae bacterium]